jgi:hypothetical protein
MSNPIVPPETPNETLAINQAIENIKDVLSLHDLRHQGTMIINSPSLRAVLRLLYVSGEQAGISKRKDSDG